MVNVQYQQPPKLKQLPKGFINQYIVDQLKEIGVKFIKRVMPVNENNNDVQNEVSNNTIIDYIITCKDRYEFEQILEMIQTMLGNRFNRYIQKVLGDPREYDRRSVTIFEYTADDKTNIIKLHIRGDL